MPGEEVTVSATFEVEATAVDNTEAAVKTVKVVRDGQVLILRDGKIFNIMGTELN
jgi:predicted transcriptional regulator